ncbi:MAG TPA: hypothetical protein VG738_13360 [Chitinophagaceae bacterium]|nr:hypothetical protein [Chitinophagaceae bacterium]
MKYSQLIGIAAVIAIVIVCFIPWVYIPAVKITVTGLQATGTDFGKAGLMMFVLGAVNIIFFITPKIWAKRTNVFIAAILLSWAIKNYIVISACYAGECPEKRAGIYLQVLFAFVVLLMSFFPKIELPKEEN